LPSTTAPAPTSRFWGGEPTLRRRDELLAIVRRLASSGLRASLFTNGIKATRDLLVELAEAGLTDVAFHVDSTQQRPGYHSESDLNTLRRGYLERARGLPISVFFNSFENDIIRPCTRARDDACMPHSPPPGSTPNSTARRWLTLRNPKTSALTPPIAPSGWAKFSTSTPKTSCHAKPPASSNTPTAAHPSKHSELPGALYAV